MRFLRENALTFLIAVAFACGWHAIPLEWRWTVGWPLIGTLVLGVVAMVILTEVATSRATRRARDDFARAVANAPPTRCPQCGHTEHDWKGGGHWIGFRDPVTGVRPSGWESFGICEACGCRWISENAGSPRPATEAEWSHGVEATERLRAERIARATEHHPRRTGPKPIDY